jgi:hypothetical protein
MTPSPGLVAWLILAVLPAPAATQVREPGSPAREVVDTAAILRIKEEGFERSQVMAIASWLTDARWLPGQVIVDPLPLVPRS